MLPLKGRGPRTLLTVLLTGFGCEPSPPTALTPPEPSFEPALEQGAAEPQLQPAPIFERQVLIEGAGPTAGPGDWLRVDYSMSVDGTLHDDSRAPGRTPMWVRPGEGRFVKGFEMGLEGAREGDTLRLVVPPELGYGDREAGNIPPGSTLEFSIVVLQNCGPLRASINFVRESNPVRTFTTDSGASVEVLKEGATATAGLDGQVVVHYELARDTGEVLESTLDENGRPLFLTLGRGKVQRDWEDALARAGVGQVFRIAYQVDKGDIFTKKGLEDGAKLVAVVELMQVDSSK